MSVREGYKQTEIGVIPEEWEEISIGEILNVQTGKKNAQDAVENGEYPFFTRSVETQRIDSFSYDTEALFIAGEGNFAVKHYQGKFDLHQRTYMLTALRDHNVNMKFLQSAITPRIYKLVSTSVGSTVQSLRKPIIEALKVPLPPLPEQQKIAEILSTVDQKIDSIDTKIEETQTLKRGLMQRLLSEGIGHSEFKDSEIGRIPAGWEVVKLENLCTKISDGIHTTPKYVENSEYYFVNGNNLVDGKITINPQTKCISESEWQKHKKDLNDQTVLLSINGTIGNVAFFQNEQIVLGKSAAYLVCSAKLNKFYLGYLLKAERTQKYFELELTGTTIRNLSLKAIKSTPIGLPSLEEQKQIAEILSTTDEKLETLRAKKEAFETLKKGLMQKLLSGEVRV